MQVARLTSEPFSSVFSSRLDRAGTAAPRVGERHPRDVAEVVAEVDREAGDRLERAQVELLPLRRVRVVGLGT